jgi:flagellar biosynthesis protein FliQ
VHFRNETGYAHDILFDTYDEAGILALVAIVGYLAVSFTHMVRTVMDKSLSFVFRNMVLCMYVIVYLEFMVEPILQGMPWIFAVFCLIDGYVGRILRYNRNLRSKVR